jgi:hypothetical protein
MNELEGNSKLAWYTRRVFCIFCVIFTIPPCLEAWKPDDRFDLPHTKLEVSGPFRMPRVRRHLRVFISSFRSLIFILSLPGWGCPFVSFVFCWLVPTETLNLYDIGLQIARVGCCCQRQQCCCSANQRLSRHGRLHFDHAETSTGALPPLANSTSTQRWVFTVYGVYVLFLSMYFDPRPLAKRIF